MKVGFKFCVPGVEVQEIGIWEPGVSGLSLE